MMDNSLHELGTPYTEDRLLYWLKTLQPQEFFVPDFWQNKNQSLISAKYWMQKQKDFPDTKFIAVVQANDITEALECFQVYKDLGYKKIALSYGASWYKDICERMVVVNDDQSKMIGRVLFVRRLYEKGLLTDNDNIHLLGCQLPQEFGYYKDKKAIKSIDTSNPIISTIEGLKYSNLGLELKPKTRIDDIIEIEKSKIDLNLLDENLKMFRKINDL
jgi:hypothetical protein